MDGSDFVHLHNHTMYSLLDGAIKIPQLLKTASDMGMRSLAITDHGNLHGAIEFYTEAKKHRIKPIIGIETYIVPHDRTIKRSVPGVPDGGYHLILLAKNIQGFKNLIKLSSAAFLEGFYFKPRIDKGILARYSEGLIALTACLKGESASAALHGGEEASEAVIRTYLDIFDQDDFFLEIQDHGIAEEAAVRSAYKRLSQKFGLGLVATNDCHYLKREHSAAHDALLCIQTGKMIADLDRMRYATDQLYLKSAEQMKELFAATPEAIENTIRIAEKCNLELELNKNLVPKFQLPQGYKSDDEYLRYVANIGLSKRYPTITEGIQNRLDYELDIIRQMGYSGYFLIVKDFIDFAKNNGISVGPGRGSAAGSIVSYCLGITDIDPIKYNLLFERFLNPERISMPDIDIDFSDRGRDRVIQYVTEKYGRENVAQIITFGTMAARAVVRDVGRVFSIPYGDIDKIAKMIPEELGMTLERALEISADLNEAKQKDEKIARVLDYAIVLEGLARHASTHAAGVVIAPAPLTDFVPLYKSNKDEITTQFDMTDIEKLGLLKMDFLGLRTLTVIDDTLSEIARNRGYKLDLNEIPLDDKDVFKLFAEGRTVGIFQFESSGMRDYLRKLEPTDINDLIVMNALYRPGPLDSGMINVYIECKKGLRKMAFEHPLLEPILKDTYGVIVFQEQVLKIAQEFAGYSLGKADILRKAMGKKQAEVMAQQKIEFIEGASKRGIDRKIAEKVFDQIETFGRYGFVKAHSTGYAIIAYRTAYLKTHFPQEFLAASLTSEMGDTSKILMFKKECKEMGIELLPPDINECFAHFSVSDGKIIYGLAAVKNVGVAAADSIVNARLEKGKFTDIFDFCSRVDTRLVNRKALESLVACGAFDSIHPIRSRVYDSIDIALNYGAQYQKDHKAGQSLLFGQLSSSAATLKPRLKEIPPWNDKQKRDMEKRVLGFYLSSHPLEDNLIEYNAFKDCALDGLADLPDGKKITVAGIIQNIKINISRNNNQFAVITIEDFTEMSELMVWSDCLEKRKKILVEGAKILVIGVISTREGERAKIIANDILPLETAYQELPYSLHLYVKEFDLNEKQLMELVDILAANKGNAEIYFHFMNNGAELISKSRKYSVEASPQLLRDLAAHFGDECVKIQLKPEANKVNTKKYSGKPNRKS
ncbi:MAG: DNA polymerase III subunit alpha [candidate division Zixibacteria bacterium]|nr:DNA polymerase III subunit alpha [candidate division Zixibacteria bacterium]